MSRTEQFEGRKKNPAELTIEWAGAGDAGFLKAYDKETGKIQIKELSFVVLTQRHCVDGYYAKENTGAWSNEINELNETLTVRWKKDDRGGEIASGTYSEIKDELKAIGIKYHKSIYIMVTSSDQIEAGTVAKLRLKGAASFEWSTFCKANQIGGNITVAGFRDEVNGAIKFRVPQFETGELSKEDSEEAELAYEQVKSYFDTAPEAVRQVNEAVNEGDDDLPF